MTTANAAFGEQRRAVPWWIPLIEGIVLVIVGILLFTNTAATIVVLAQVLAIYWLISGIMEIVSLFLDRTAWGLKLLGGIVGIWAGLYIISNPLIGTCRRCFRSSHQTREPTAKLMRWPRAGGRGRGWACGSR